MKRQLSRSSLLRVAIPVIAILILSIAAVALVEYRYPTTTTVTSSPNPSVVYEWVTVTATVNVYGHAVPDGGTVYFYSHRIFIGSGTTVNGQVSISAYFSKKGYYNLKAKYAGDQLDRPSQGGTQQDVCAGENCG